MEKIKKYQKAILKILKDYAAIKSPFMPDVENKVIADLKNHHYQLIRLGWHEDRHIHYTVFHFDIIDGKILIQENRTDVRIREELVDAGIPSKDILSGLKSPKMKLLEAQPA